MLITIAEFNEYTGDYEESAQTVELKNLILSSAQEVVGQYLRYDPESKREPQSVPSIVRLTILRIATLMLMESGENIGITGKSFADNSRSFISYTNYSK